MPGFALQIEADLHVDAAVAEVAVERRLVVVFVQQRAQVAQVRAQLLRRDRRIVPPFPVERRARGRRRGARARLADLPHRLRFAGRVETHRSGGSGEPLQALDELARALFGACRGSSDPNSTSR